MDENIANEITQLKKQLERTETHLYHRMDTLEEIFNENPDRVNAAFDEVEEQRKYLLDRINYTDKDLKDLREISRHSWNAQEEKARLTNEQVNQKFDGLAEQVFALGKLAENLEERARRMEQNWTLVKKQMAIIQSLVNGIAPDDKKLPVDWLNQLEMVRDIVNPQPKTETEVKND